MKPLSIDGCWLFTPSIHRDNRGSFHEWFRDAEFSAALRYQLEVAQSNCAVSHLGAIRGIHFADVPPGQAKYVTCVRGAILDVVVDLRVGSPGYGHWVAVRLDDEERQALFVSEGLGHAFLTLSDVATVVYLCSTPYAPEREHGVHPLDPDIGITWPKDLEVILSEKDAAAPTLEEAKNAGLLPSYQACMMRTAQLGSQR